MKSHVARRTWHVVRRPSRIPPVTCNDAEPQIARYADDELSLPVNVRQELDAHLAICAACRAALDEQRRIAGLLRARLATAPQPGLVARVSVRIDRERGTREPDQGWLGILNWRGWTVGLAPLAVALIVAAYIDMRGEVSNGTPPSVDATFEEWTTASAPAALQPTATGDALIEAVLTGTAPSSGDPDGR
jgi:anti-sigma factor RsiW